MNFDYDVVIIGGAFSGAATALMLKRKHPAARILIIEKVAEFNRKVGKSTTELSSCYMTRLLGLTNYLRHHHLAKQGLRMWKFYNRRLVALAQRRLATGCYGQRNAGSRELYDGFVPDGRVWKLIRKGLSRWWRAELTNLRLILTRPAKQQDAAIASAPRAVELSS